MPQNPRGRRPGPGQGPRTGGQRRPPQRHRYQQTPPSSRREQNRGSPNKARQDRRYAGDRYEERRSASHRRSGQAERKGRTLERKRTKKTSTGKKVVNAVIIVFCVLFIAMGGLMVWGHSALSSMYKPLNGGDVNDSNILPSGLTQDQVNQILPGAGNHLTDDLFSDQEVFNVLLVGADDDGNSDTMMLISIDNKHQKLKMTSFMRDTVVDIPGKQGVYRYKLNASFGAGGVPLVIETIERNFGINIDKYAEVDFECFRKVIDILGGVKVTLTQPEVEFINDRWKDGHPLTNGAGTYILDSGKALVHARNRSSGMWDYGRTARQRDVIRATIEGFKNTDVVSMLKIAASMMEYVNTDMNPQELSQLIYKAPTYMNYEMEEFRLPTNNNLEEKTISQFGGAVLIIPDIQQARADLKEFIYGEGAPEGTMPSTTDRVRNGE